MKNFSHKVSFVLVIALVYWSFKGTMPQDYSRSDAPKTSFSTERALIQLSQIAQKPHYVGSPEHKKVRDYIIGQLEELGLAVQVQEGYTLPDWGNMSKPKNILARIKGSDNTKALLLLTHYDSSPHSSLGASDAGSGVVTIIEGLRAFLAADKTPKNDIIILISDSEELGLNGADLFVNQHPWAKEVGLVLNFEARGSGGPSYMLIETNGGNAKLIKEFQEANPDYPVTNSLAYSIYKMLPNDTDLTVFRRDGDIEGFNFAFIDDHFDYHTANDTYANLDRNTLEHQGSYLMPLLNYFSMADLTKLKSGEDYVYFNMPWFKLLSYPFSWIYVMLFLAVLLFVVLIVHGLKKERLTVTLMLKGFVPFLGMLIVGGIIGYYGWPALKSLYPGYGEILQGFTYNGQWYIAFFSVLTIGIGFLFYKGFQKPAETVNYLIAPIFVWILINIAVAISLKGAGFFIIPVYFALLALYVLIRQKKPSMMALTLICTPAILMFSPFVQMFPVGLGLKMLVTSTVFTSLIFGLLLPVIGFYRRKKILGHSFLILALAFLITAHVKSGFNENAQKPNSLIYMLDSDSNQANWVTYDGILDDWTKKYLGENPSTAVSTNTISSKYGSGFTYSNKADVKEGVRVPLIDITKDTIVDKYRYIDLCISPQRFVNRIEFFAGEQFNFKSFTVNGVDAKADGESEFVLTKRRGNRLISYYMSDQEPIEISFSAPKDQKPELLLYEASFDLLENELFSVPNRPDDMIPKPFILNDAVLVKKIITF